MTKLAIGVCFIFIGLVILAIIFKKKLYTVPPQQYALTFTQSGFNCITAPDGTMTLLECSNAGNGAFCFSQDNQQCNSIQGSSCQVGELIFANEQLCNENLLPYSCTLTTTGKGYVCAKDKNGTYITLDGCTTYGNGERLDAYCFF